MSKTKGKNESCELDPKRQRILRGMQEGNESVDVVPKTFEFPEEESVDMAQLLEGIQRARGTPNFVDLTRCQEIKGHCYCGLCQRHKTYANFHLQFFPKCYCRPMICKECWTWRHYFSIVAPCVELERIVEALLEQNGRCWRSGHPLRMEFEEPRSCIVSKRGDGKLILVCKFSP